MKTKLYLLALLSLLVFVSGCTSNGNQLVPDSPSFPISYGCILLEDSEVDIEKNQMSANNNLCSFELQNPDSKLDYIADGVVIENVQNELKINSECKRTLTRTSFSEKIVIDSENNIYGCVSIRGE